MNKFYLLITFLTLLLSACGPEVYRDENGRQSFSVTCTGRVSYCYQQASETCPNGYNVIDRLVSRKTSSTSVSGKDDWENDSVSASKSTDERQEHELLYNCK